MALCLGSDLPEVSENNQTKLLEKLVGQAMPDLLTGDKSITFLGLGSILDKTFFISLTK